MSDPDELLAGLNEEQRRAATATTGPVVIHAGAGTGKTRVIVHRVAYAVATGAVDPGHILLVTFTEKAATEMRQRVAELGVPRVAVMTFHAAARRQLQHFWPQVHGTAAPGTLADPWPLIAPMTRKLPGGFKFTPTKDLIDTIGWLRSQRFDLAQAEAAADEADRTLPLPVDLLGDLIERYESEKRRRNVIDFNDMIDLTTELLRDNAEIRAQVHPRYRWFSVDEFQDTSLAQNELLGQWLGDRHDICVVGDADQTIYSFTGASARFLQDFPKVHPGTTVLELTQNYRSSPQVIALANRLLAAPGSSSDKLRATLPDGPDPTITEHADETREIDAIVTRIRELLAEGMATNEIAVLTRLNADLAPFEAALTRARIPHQVRGQRFFERREVQQAARLLRSLPAEASGENLLEAVTDLLGQHLGYDADEEPRAGQARERQAALTTWLQMVAELADPEDPKSPQQIFERLAELARAEADASGTGVELATLHRAKGLEWDAVFIPGVEEGRVPVSQAKTDAAIAEEKRLLYVGITRARRVLAISWASNRAGVHGSSTRRRSRFLAVLVPRAAGRAGSTGSARRPGRTAAPSVRSSSGTVRSGRTGPGRTGPGRTTGAASAASSDDHTEIDIAPDPAGMTALKEWRATRAKADGVPAYVICHDRTLAAIVESQPTDAESLLAVPGIGPAKLERYGAELLAVLHQGTGD